MNKKNGTLMKILIALAGITATVLLTSIVWVWNAAGVVKDVEINEIQIKEMKPIVSASEKAIIGIKKDISHLAQKVEENSITQRQILILQQDILREVRK